MQSQKLNRLYFDIETSPNTVLSWRLGSRIYLDHHNLLEERKIICIAYKWSSQKDPYVLTWDRNQCDKRALKTFVEAASNADELIAHNGDGFDLPWIRTRCLFHGIDMMPEYKTIDTLQWSRRKFYFNSNRLDYLGSFMGIGGKIKTEFNLWKKVMKNDEKALAEMVKYAKRDVTMLQQVHERLERYVPHKTHVAVLNRQDKWMSPFNGSKNVHQYKRRVTARGTVQYQMKCVDTGRYYTISEATHKDYQEFMKQKKDKK